MLRPFAARSLPNRRPFAAAQPTAAAMPPVMQRAQQRVAKQGRPLATPFGVRSPEQAPAAATSRSDLLSTQNDLLRTQNSLLERIATALEQFTPPREIDDQEEPIGDQPGDLPIEDAPVTPTQLTDPLPGETIG